MINFFKFKVCNVYPKSLDIVVKDYDQENIKYPRYISWQKSDFEWLSSITEYRNYFASQISNTFQHFP